MIKIMAFFCLVQVLTMSNLSDEEAQFKLVTEFHETWWSYRYMFLVGPKVFSFVVKGVKVIF
jgi:hypothetical protein